MSMVGGHYGMKTVSDLRPLLGDEARKVKCLQNESNTYRAAIVRLLTASMSGGRKTMDKSEIKEILGHALESGNAWFRKSKEEE